MANPRICLCFVSAITLLLFGLPLGALEAPVASGAQTEGASGPIWLAAGPDAAALPETGKPQPAPDDLAIAAGGGAANPGSQREQSAGISGRPLLRVPPRLYLSHCAFLC